MQRFRFAVPEDIDCSPVVFPRATEVLANDAGMKTACADSCSEHQPFGAAKQTADRSQHTQAQGSGVIRRLLHCEKHFRNQDLLKASSPHM